MDKQATLSPLISQVRQRIEQLCREKTDTQAKINRYYVDNTTAYAAWVRGWKKDVQHLETEIKRAKDELDSLLAQCQTNLFE